jgi:hypothetical protein
MFSIFNKLTGRQAAEAEPPEGTPAAAAATPAAASALATDPIVPVPPPPDLDVAALVAPPAQPATETPFGPVDAARTEALRDGIVAAISTVFDP